MTINEKESVNINKKKFLKSNGLGNFAIEAQIMAIHDLLLKNNIASESDIVEAEYKYFEQINIPKDK